MIWMSIVTIDMILQNNACYVNLLPFLYNQNQFILGTIYIFGDAS